MTDAGDYWGVIVDHQAKDDLGLVPLLGDPSLDIKRNDEDVDGFLVMCVDDGCLAGNEAMQQLTKLALQIFESRPREWDNFDFFATSISETVAQLSQLCEAAILQYHRKSILEG